MMLTLLTVGMIIVLVGWNLAVRTSRSRAKAIQESVQIAKPPRPPRPQQPIASPEIEGHGAAAILARSAVARVHRISKPLEDYTYHVKRQPDRMLAVVIRKGGVTATDRIIKLYGENEGSVAWTYRDKLDYQVEAA